MAPTLDKVLIRKAGAATPHVYDGLPADSTWRLAGVWNGVVVELHFDSREDAQAFAEHKLRITGKWDDPDGDGNYCIVD